MQIEASSAVPETEKRSDTEKMYRIKDGYCLRNFCGESLVLPISRSTMSENRTALLSPVGSFIWEKLKTWQTFDDLLDAVLNEYEVERETAKKDILAFLNELEAKKYSITKGI